MGDGSTVSPRTAQRIERQTNRNSSANRPYFNAESANGVTPEPSRNSSVVVPIVIRSPSASSRVWIVWPFRRVPFVEPRSVRTYVPFA